MNQRLDQLDKRETELLEKIEEQTNLVKKLKEDRAYYRTKCDEKESVDKFLLLLTYNISPLLPSHESHRPMMDVIPGQCTFTAAGNSLPLSLLQLSITL